MALNESYGFLSGNKVPYWPTKASTFGDSINGTICEEPTVSQQTEPNGALKTWPDGNPMMQMVVTIKTGIRDPQIEEDDGRRTLYVKGQMQAALRDAVTAVGRKGIDVGGEITMVYTHDKEPASRGLSPARQFSCVYKPPTQAATAAFLGTQTESTPAVTTTAEQNGTAAVPENLPAGMTPEVWKTLTPEAQAALMALSAPKSE